MRVFLASLVLAVGTELPAPAPAAPEPLFQDTATVKGVVKVKGAIPKRSKISTSADPKCTAKDGLLSEEVVADPAGRLQYALVYIKKGLEDKKFDVPKKPVVLEQKSCRFEPHVFGIMVGQELMIRNGDELMHIAHVVPRENKEWGFSQARPGEQRPKIFDKPELPIRVFCDVHPWMQAWAGVLAHPFHSTTDPLGRFEIKGIPAGKYTLEVWHEYYKSFEAEIELKGRETKTLNVDLTDKK